MAPTVVKLNERKMRRKNYIDSCVCQHPYIVLNPTPQVLCFYRFCMLGPNQLANQLALSTKVVFNLKELLFRFRKCFNDSILSVKGDEYTKS